MANTTSARIKAGANCQVSGMLQPKLMMLSLSISIQDNSAPSGIDNSHTIQQKISKGMAMSNNCSD